MAPQVPLEVVASDLGWVLVLVSALGLAQDWALAVVPAMGPEG